MILQINEEFKNLIPPLSSEEFSQLKENILKDGCRDALVIWDDTIVDGHNRYQICTENGIEFKTIEKEFDTQEDAIAWIIKNQFGRRNLLPFQRGELALRLKPLIQEKAKENQVKSGGAVPQKSAKPIDTRDELAKIAGVSHDTITKTEKIINKGTPEQIERAKKGGKGNSVNAIYHEIKEQTEMKICKKCGEEFEKDSFYAGKGICKSCYNSGNRYRPTGINADILANMKDPNDDFKITWDKESRAELAASIERLYDPSSVPDTTIELVIETFEANYKTYFNSLDKILEIDLDLVKMPENNKKIMAVLSEAETALSKMKGKYQYE